MLRTVAAEARGGLNDSGEDHLARIFEGGALHHARGASTSEHAHYAWKIHVGLDAPVWVQGDAPGASVQGDARVLIIPPGFQHRTGATGWSLAVFLAPGRRRVPWRASRPAFALEGHASRRIVDLCRSFEVEKAGDTAPFAAELSSYLEPSLGPICAIDARVEDALSRLHTEPKTPLPKLARHVGLSLDRLSRLTVQETGLNLRRHVLWTKVLGFLQAGAPRDKLAETACAAGFSDHAHMTRTFRQFLGRVPSEFTSPPEVIGKW
jgi:AraC family transcriptional regulator